MKVDRLLRRTARDRFGWQELRPAQLTAMRAVLDGRDVLVVLPTGAGKSAVYQVPAVLRDGPTVVVSPLLALQQDQMTALAERDQPELAAVRMSGADGKRRSREALEAVRDKKAEFLFLTPEQLADPRRLAEVRAAAPSLVVVDEAHCVSAWGYDFRPDYLRLGDLIRELGGAPVVALTATASPPVREDITARLGLRDPLVVVGELDRPEIFLEAAHCPDEELRWQRLLDRIRQSPPPGLVYAATRRATTRLAARLTDEGVDATAYHGGMSGARRDRIQDDFMADRIPVLVATSAFGMGVDKPDIRWVNHCGLPDSLDSYFQEVGRAARDGEPAQALLLYRVEDLGLRRYFTGAPPREEDLVKVARGEHAGFGRRRLTRLLSLLEQIGTAGGPEDRARRAVVEGERLRAVERSRLEMMLQYAETPGCRRRLLLGYLGDPAGSVTRPCGNCDNCLSQPEAVTSGPYPIHSAVRHAEWGEGVVLGYQDDRMFVHFTEVGYRTLSVPVVREQALLTPASGR